MAPALEPAQIPDVGCQPDAQPYAPPDAQTHAQPDAQPGAQPGAPEPDAPNTNGSICDDDYDYRFDPHGGNQHWFINRRV